MIPSVNRFIGALQGITDNATPEEGGGALEIAESILANGGFVLAEVESIVSGLATEGDSPGAPLWRAIPFGLLYFRELDKLQANTEKACRLTHGDQTDIASAIAMALTVARLLRMQELSPIPFIREIAWFVKKIDHDAYTRILGLMYPLRNELPFLCSNFTKPLEIFRAAIFLFLSCQSGDLETEAERHGLQESPALPLAYTLMGSFGRLCKIEKPSLRVVLIAEAFQNFAEGVKIELPQQDL